MSKSLEIQSKEGADYLNTFSKAPRVGVILGSGLSSFGEKLHNAISIPYSDIPHFHHSTVAGHAGQLCIGELDDGTPVAALCGRSHLYEGLTAQQIVQPIRTLAQWGLKSMIITNAAGGISDKLWQGALMLITDQLNLTGQSPLTGPVYSNCARFVDMTQAYDLEFQSIILQSARTLNIPLQKGTYAGLLGPNYETPAEIYMFRQMGASSVGMSTVLEVIAARQLNIKIAGISCITNMAAGIQGAPLNHSEVKETAQKVHQSFTRLLETSLSRLNKL